MTKIEQIRKDMMEALKSREMERKNALSILLSALKAKAIDKRADLTSEEENDIVYKEIRQTKETLESTPADRTGIIAECETKIKIYSEYVPKLMGEDEIKKEIAAVLSELGISSPTAKDKGGVMKALMPRVKGKADGGLVNRLVGEALK